MKLKDLAILLIFGALTAQADVLTPADALMRAAESLPATVDAGRRIAARRAPATPLQTVGGDEPEVYVFGSPSAGLIVASADSETEPLLGYSENYVEGAELPPSLKWLIGYYGREISALRAGKVVKRAVRKATRSDYDAIEPLCATTWNQGAPYYYDCPPLNNKYCVTGCVATAMAQVLKTYAYPAQCSGGTFSYEWSTGNKTLSKNFNNVTLKWDKMLDSYASNTPSSNTNAQAVAELMSAIGYASQMDYSPNGSGTQGVYCAQGLIRNFDYDYSLQFLKKDWFDLDTWNAMVYGELAKGHPVYYDGANLEEKTGHAFVIDGYQANGYFHVNWGWGGQLNGYFLLTALDPEGEQGIGGSSGGYSDEAAAIFNMSPGKTMTAAEGPMTIWSDKALTPPTTSAISVGSAFSVPVTIYSYTPYTLPDVALCLEFVDSEGNAGYTSPVSFGELDTYYGGSATYRTKVPSGLADGKYTVRLCAANLTTSTAYDVYYNNGVTSKITATIADSKVTFSEYQEPIEEAMYFDDFTAPSVIYFDQETTLSANFVNATQSPYTGTLNLTFYDKDTDKPSLAFNTVEFTLKSMTYITWNPKFIIESGNLEPGEYIIRLSTDNDEAVSEAKTVTVRYPAAVVEASNFECISTAANAIDFTVDLTALNSDYSGTIALAIAKTRNSTVLWSDKFDAEIAKDQTITKQYVDLDLTDKLTPGTSYVIYGIYVDENGKSANFEGDAKISFTATDELVGIESVEVKAAEAEYFDLTGRRALSPKAGLYIRRQGTNTQTQIIR